MTTQRLPITQMFRRPSAPPQPASEELDSTRKVMMGSALASFFGMGTVGWFAGNALFDGLGVLAMPSSAFLGMITALLIADRPPKRPRERRRLP